MNENDFIFSAKSFKNAIVFIGTAMSSFGSVKGNVRKNYEGFQTYVKDVFDNILGDILDNIDTLREDVRGIHEAIHATNASLMGEQKKEVHQEFAEDFLAGGYWSPVTSLTLANVNIKEILKIIDEQIDEIEKIPEEERTEEQKEQLEALKLERQTYSEGYLAIKDMIKDEKINEKFREEYENISTNELEGVSDQAVVAYKSFYACDAIMKEAQSKGDTETIAKLEDSYNEYLINYIINYGDYPKDAKYNVSNMKDFGYYIEDVLNKKSSGFDEEMLKEVRYINARIMLFYLNLDVDNASANPPKEPDYHNMNEVSEYISKKAEYEEKVKKAKDLRYPFIEIIIDFETEKKLPTTLTQEEIDYHVISGNLNSKYKSDVSRWDAYFDGVGEYIGDKIDLTLARDLDDKYRILERDGVYITSSSQYSFSYYYPKEGEIEAYKKSLIEKGIPVDSSGFIDFEAFIELLNTTYSEDYVNSDIIATRHFNAGKSTAASVDNFGFAITEGLIQWGENIYDGTVGLVNPKYAASDITEEIMANNIVASFANENAYACWKRDGLWYGIVKNTTTGTLNVVQMAINPVSGAVITGFGEAGKSLEKDINAYINNVDYVIEKDKNGNDIKYAVDKDGKYLLDSNGNKQTPEQYVMNDKGFWYSGDAWGMRVKAGAKGLVSGGISYFTYGNGPLTKTATGLMGETNKFGKVLTNLGLIKSAPVVIQKGAVLVGNSNIFSLTKSGKVVLEVIKSVTNDTIDEALEVKAVKRDENGRVVYDNNGNVVYEEKRFMNTKFYDELIQNSIVSGGTVYIYESTFANWVKTFGKKFDNSVAVDPDKYTKFEYDGQDIYVPNEFADQTVVTDDGVQTILSDPELASVFEGAQSGEEIIEGANIYEFIAAKDGTVVVSKIGGTLFKTPIKELGKEGVDVLEN